MALQDLTPQLRTRLSRMERTVGWFVFVATALLLFGFGYYLYHTAENKGWFKIKAPFFTFVKSATGLNVGAQVFMMGSPVGQITRITVMPPRDPHNVKVEFEITGDSIRQLWTDGSYAKMNSGLLGQSQLEVTRGTNGYALVVTQPVMVFSNLDELRQKVVAQPDHWQLSQEVFDANSNLIFRAYTQLTESNLAVIAALNPPSIYAYNNTEHDAGRIVASWHPRSHRYENFEPGSTDAWIKMAETPALGDQLQAIVSQVQGALPGILALTNKLAAVLDNANATLGNAALATSNLNQTIVAAQPLVHNFADISTQLREPGGVVNWAIGTNGDLQIQTALTNLNSLLAHTDTNLDALVINIGQTLDNVADITGGLRKQVEANTNMLSSIGKIVIDSDNLVQGLKRHWLLRSAFKKENKAADDAAKAAKAAAAKK
jgi:ABC-type transporter Mla subunit MlaD